MATEADGMKKTLGWALPGVCVLLLDQAVKRWAEGKTQTLLPGVLGLKWQLNTGMAFGMLTGNAAGILIASALLTVLGALFLRKSRPRGMARLSISLIMGGALGNMLDRLLLGSVRDMLEFLFIRFPVFNIADAGVVTGAVLCGVSLLFRPQDWGGQA